MKINYISRAVEDEVFRMLFPEGNKMPGQQAHKFNKLLMQGIARNNVNIKSLSSVPATPSNCEKKIIMPPRSSNHGVLYQYLPTFNFPVIKNLFHMVSAFLSVMGDAAAHRECAVVCDILQVSASVGAVAAARILGLPCVGIVTDFPDLLNADPAKFNRKTSRYVRMAYSVIHKCSHYVFLTEAMHPVLNPQNKPYVVIEGFCDIDMQHKERIVNEAVHPNRCIYAGLLDVRYGIKAMVEGFLSADLPDTELHLYGSGSYVDELSEIVRTNKNIIYHGNIPVDEVVEAELRADLLINPRPTCEEFTKYSFPSKNMEYMVSGTPVMTTRLPGMPQEYYDYVWLIDDESSEGIAKALSDFFGQPKAERDEKGRRARSFVLEHKNNVKQAAKILRMLTGNV